MSPFRSEAQRRHLWATDPTLAAEFARDTPEGPLPDHVEQPPKAPKTKVRAVRKPKVRRAGS